MASSEQLCTDLLRPLWVELRVVGLTRVFPVASAYTKPIIVGAVPHADIRVSRPGVLPVHFLMVRHGDEIWVVPAPSAEVRVNAARVPEGYAIAGHARIEFCGVSVDAFIHEECPFIDMQATVQRLAFEHERADLPEYLLDDSEPTRVVIPLGTAGLLRCEDVATTAFYTDSECAELAAQSIEGIDESDLDAAFDAAVANSARQMSPVRSGIVAHRIVGVLKTERFVSPYAAEARSGNPFQEGCAVGASDRGTAACSRLAVPMDGRHSLAPRHVLLLASLAIAVTLLVTFGTDWLFARR